jgi:arylformamidase
MAGVVMPALKLSMAQLAAYAIPTLWPGTCSMNLLTDLAPLPAPAARWRLTHVRRLVSALPLAASLMLHPTATHAGPLRDWLAKRHQAAASQPADEHAQDDSLEPQVPPRPSANLPGGARQILDLPYGADPRQRMDVYLPANPQNASAILMVHGGAWAIGDKAHGKVVANKLAHWLPQGVALISVNYRMLPGASPTEQALDVARALAAAQKRATGWGLNPQAFVLMGHSAGAHIVALLSAQPVLAVALGASPWLGSVLLDSAALDVPRIMQAPGHMRLYDKAFGADPAYWLKASPLHQLGKDAPPMLAVCSSKRQDSCDQARAFADKATSMGAQVKVLPQALSHGDINGVLGTPGAYSEAVDAFMAALPGFRRATSP